MSKYESLWQWIRNSGEEVIELSFFKIENILGFPIDHSFLTFKKELFGYGYKVLKISMKKKIIYFEKLN